MENKMTDLAELLKKSLAARKKVLLKVGNLIDALDKKILELDELIGDTKET